MKKLLPVVSFYILISSIILIESPLSFFEVLMKKIYRFQLVEATKTDQLCSRMFRLRRDTTQLRYR